MNTTSLALDDITIGDMSTVLSIDTVTKLFIVYCKSAKTTFTGTTMESAPYGNTSSEVTLIYPEPSPTAVT